ncbi:AimR family lysis-lysogeny pheromone receptor [Bacillus sp. T33-2]|uniref:AimR family lysis-lysogeny pheromone receptor n=1 Tax=Bacillus sp. T33-2 TaxID=2054168 RepID=UPI000C76D339|nr:AimR family lysis-lysogeny pheromone receptor [Bacillus sp. T33-2]PLR99571.1 hypothetical protein CVD19_00475 [Bacillus sp. T33-2]
MSKSLYHRILNEIELAPRGYAEELAKIAGYASGSALKKPLRKDGDFDKFSGLIHLVNTLWKDEAVTIMVKYSSEVNTNKKSARYLLEYLSVNKQYEALHNLIERMSDTPNIESKAWAKVYKLAYQYHLAKTEEDYTNLLMELSFLNVTVTELKVFKLILQNYCFNQKSDFVMTDLLVKEIQRDIEVIEKDYIKEMYWIRTKEVLSYNLLRVRNNPEAARECADYIIESNAPEGFKAYAYFIKGYSYKFTSYENSHKYLTISMDMYKKLNRDFEVDDLKEKIEFLDVYWNRTQTENFRYVNNYLLYHIMKGKDLTKVLIEAKNKINPAFHAFLQGINSNDEKKLIISTIKYVKRGDNFLANLPRIELLKREYDDEILEELIG